MQKRPALVISTYNSPNLLGICLSSLSNQSDFEFDVFIADDGSTPETKEKIELYRNLLPVSIKHYWHEDRGYNKAEINNEVFRDLKKYPFVICVDGDTFLHTHFIEDHKNAHRGASNTLFMGRRIDLGPLLTGKVNEENVVDLNRGVSLPLLISFAKKDTKNFSRAIRMKSSWIRRVLGRDKVNDILGSNFSISTDLLYFINGYNEDYKAYWGEDGDLFIRARNSGASVFGSKSFAIQYHLDHPRLDPSNDHQSRYQNLLNKPDYVRCENGIQKFQ